MRRLLILAAMIVLSSSLAAQDIKPYESKAGKYKVVFPETGPTVSSTKVGEDELNVAKLAYKGGGFMVTYTDLNEDKVKMARPKDILDVGEKGLIEAFNKPKITSTKDIEIGKQKYPARQITTGESYFGEEGVSIKLRLTLVLADNRLYQVFVFGPKDLPASKEADKFFESFEITK